MEVLWLVLDTSDLPIPLGEPKSLTLSEIHRLDERLHLTDVRILLPSILVIGMRPPPA